MKTVKPRKCKECGSVFTPKYSTIQATCGITCSIAYAKRVKANKEAKEWEEEKKERKEALMSYSDWLKLLQVTFNAFIRERDKGRECVSCGCKVDNGHASHFFATASHPNLRFDEDNVHLSCVEDNLHLHGNLIEYSLRLPKRIGQERYDALLDRSKKTTLKLSVPEIKEMIQKYKLLTKQLKNKK